MWPLLLARHSRLLANLCVWFSQRRCVVTAHGPTHRRGCLIYFLIKMVVEVKRENLRVSYHASPPRFVGCVDACVCRLVDTIAKVNHCVAPRESSAQHASRSRTLQAKAVAGIVDDVHTIHYPLFMRLDIVSFR